MIYELVPRKVFLTNSCEEANRPRCPYRGGHHVHIGCGGENNWPMMSIAILQLTLKILEAVRHITKPEREDAARKLERRDGDGLPELAAELAGKDEETMEYVFFIKKGEDPLTEHYRVTAGVVVQSVFFPG